MNHPYTHHSSKIAFWANIGHEIDETNKTEIFMCLWKWYRTTSLNFIFFMRLGDFYATKYALFYVFMEFMDAPNDPTC